MRVASTLVLILVAVGLAETVAAAADLLGAVGGATLEARPLPCAPCASCIGLAFERDEHRKTHCEEGPKKRFWLATTELLTLEAIPQAFGQISGNEFSKISLNSWKDNLENPWKWDNNHFINNQFSHPYHGAVFYNAARANGYDFWASAAWPFAGSLLWEYFGEKWAPAPNDFFNTSLGGVSLGETLWRLSSLVLDNRATGGARVFREIGAGLINPVRGFTRLVTGDTSRVGDNPDEFRPWRIQAALDIGYRSNAATLSDIRRSVGQGFFGATLIYGDVFDASAPFQHFVLRGELALPNKAGLQTRTLTTLLSHGTLASWSLHDGKHSHHRIALFLTYDYLINPAYEFGGQGVAAGWVGAPVDTRDFRLTLQALAHGYAIAATFSDYFRTDEGRNYDYGPGYGGSGVLGLWWKGHVLLRGSANARWIETVSGIPGRHYESFVDAEGRIIVGRRFGVGGMYRRFHRTSEYDDFPSVRLEASEARVFLTLAIPRYEP